MLGGIPRYTDQLQSVQNSMQPDEFNSPSLGRISFEGVVERLQAYVREEPDARYRLIIGTDSLPGFEGRVALVSAIVMHRVGHGGIYCWRRQVHQSIVTLRDRMLGEALASIELATRLREHPALRDFVGSTIEIHVDVGQNGPTRQMIAEIVGMVSANGFIVKTKPDSYAATKVADRHTVSVYALAK